MHCCTAAQLHTVVPRAVGDIKYKIRTKMTSVGSQHRLALNFTNGTIWWWMRILCQKKFSHFLLWNLNGMYTMRIDSYPVEIMFKWALFHWYHTSLPLIKFNGLTLCPVSWRPWQHRIAKEQKDGECLDQEAVLGNVGDGDGGEVGRRHQGDLVERPFPNQWHFSLLFILPQSLEN